MNTPNKTFKGSQIELDLNDYKFKRESDKIWHKLPTPHYVALTSIGMQQTGGGRGGRINHKYKAFCVYIKAGELNILAYRGRKDNVLREANRISKFLAVEIKDFLPRNPDGSIIDDDENSIGCLPLLIIAIINIIVLSFVF